jgi:hypothetical protein
VPFPVDEVDVSLPLVAEGFRCRVLAMSSSSMLSK